MTKANRVRKRNAKSAAAPIARMLSKGNPATKKEHKCRGFVVNLGVNDRRRRANAYSSRLLVGEWMIDERESAAESGSSLFPGSQHRFDEKCRKRSHSRCKGTMHMSNTTLFDCQNMCEVFDPVYSLRKEPHMQFSSSESSPQSSLPS